MFVMTDDTRNCDEVAAYLESRYPELANAVLVIHTKNNGEISEAASGKSKEELDLACNAGEPSRPEMWAEVHWDGNASSGAVRRHFNEPRRLPQGQHADPALLRVPDVA